MDVAKHITLIKNMQQRIQQKQPDPIVQQLQNQKGNHIACTLWVQRQIQDMEIFHSNNKQT